MVLQWVFPEIWFVLEEIGAKKSHNMIKFNEFSLWLRNFKTPLVLFSHSSSTKINKQTSCEKTASAHGALADGTVPCVTFSITTIISLLSGSKCLTSIHFLTDSSHFKGKAFFFFLQCGLLETRDCCASCAIKALFSVAPLSAESVFKTSLLNHF